MLRYAEREARVWAKLWHGSLSTGILTPILFLGAMGVGVGGMVDDHSGSVQGVDYLTFVAPGLLVAMSVQHVTPTALWATMAGHKWAGHFRAAVATPLQPRDIYGGYLLWQGAHTLMNAIPFLIVAAAMGGVPSWWGGLAAPVAAVTAIAVAAPLAAFSCSQDRDTGFAAILRLIVLPMVLFSGVFFPIENLPLALRPIAWLTPLWHGVELSRTATTGDMAPGPILLHTGFLAAFITLAALWGVRAFNRRLRT